MRDARPEDAAFVAELSTELGDVLRRMGNPIGAVLSEADLLRDAFSSNPAFGLLVAELDRAVVGYLLHHPSYNPDLGGRVTTVVDLYVAESSRRRGVGRTLMDAALELCSRAGGHALVWWVRPTNREAVAFYEGLGASVQAGPVSMYLPVARGPTRRSS